MSSVAPIILVYQVYGGHPETISKKVTHHLAACRQLFMCLEQNVTLNLVGKDFSLVFAAEDFFQPRGVFNYQNQNTRQTDSDNV